LPLLAEQYGLYSFRRTTLYAFFGSGGAGARVLFGRVSPVARVRLGRVLESAVGLACEFGGHMTARR
jgi:hypothetical protein